MVKNKKNKQDIEEKMKIGIDLIPVSSCNTTIYYNPDDKKYAGVVQINGNHNKNLYITLQEVYRNYD